MGLEKQYVINKEVVDYNLMTCPLCERILVNPCLCGVCKTHFCFTCLQSYLKQYVSSSLAAALIAL